MLLNNRIFLTGALTALALSAGGCGTLDKLTADKTSSADNGGLPTEQYKVKVEQTPDRLALAPHATGLSTAQTVALGEFANRWLEAGQGEIAIQAPSGGDATAVSRTAAATQDALAALGVPRTMIKVEGYTADAQAPLLVTFQRYTAKGPDCDFGWNNLTSTANNDVTTHFGCAVTANFAAQLANPRDLLQPAPSAPADAIRRETVLGAYRKGENTSTKQDDQANGAVSRVVR